MKGTVQPKADQPRVTQKDLTKDSPNLQYRVQGAKSMSNRSLSRPDKRSPLR
jgi:hypothetical protein